MSSDGLLSVWEARELLGWSKDKMTRAIKTGQLATIPSPHDQRYKFIRRADVEALLAQPRPHRKNEPPAPTSETSG